jgi:hypothetical protein
MYSIHFDVDLFVIHEITHMSTPCKLSKLAMKLVVSAKQVDVVRFVRILSSTKKN